LDQRFYKVEWLPTATNSTHWYATGKYRQGTAKYTRIDVKYYFPRQFKTVLIPDDSMEELEHMIAAFDDEMIVTGAGKSGSTMYWSKNREFIAKTMTKIEVQQAKFQIPQYTAHVAWNPDSLLAKCYGMIRVKSGFDTTYILIMRNALFEEPRPKCILKSSDGWPSSKPTKKVIYDLKGSTYGRSAKPAESIKKDLDFVRANHGIEFHDDTALNNFLVALRRDVEFLKFLCVLDYSLLVSVVPDPADGRDPELRLAIIDFWTPFTNKKKAEHFLMGTLHGRSKISCIPPYLYGERFAEFIMKFARVRDA
jgi:hypothetical protein